MGVYGRLGDEGLAFRPGQTDYAAGIATSDRGGAPSLISPAMTRPLRFTLLAALVLLAGCDSTDETVETSVRVMSQNLYLGGDLFTVVAESNAQLVPLRVAQLYGTIQASDPATRMAAIAAEIARVGPDLVGLQEVSTYYVQTPGDNHTGSPTQATNKTFDFLDLLLDALEDEGVSYRVASQSNNSDVELPATADGTTFFDVRYQDADVILARQGVETGNPVETRYQTLLTVAVGGVSQQFVRSYQTVDATVDGVEFTFANTHLEVGGQAAIIQLAQGTALAAEISTLSGPVILVGDLNSDAGGGGTATYGVITAANTGLVDAAGPGAGTPTCCQAADVRNATSQLDTRIDLILTRGFTTSGFETVLNTPSDRTSGGLWPSDHAGVWADLDISVAL